MSQQRVTLIVTPALVFSRFTRCGHKVVALQRHRWSASYSLSGDLPVQTRDTRHSSRCRTERTRWGSQDSIVARRCVGATRVATTASHPLARPPVHNTPIAIWNQCK